MPCLRAILAGGLVVAATAAAAEPAGRPSPRPERTLAERSLLAARLRNAYAKPPAAWPAPHVDPGVGWRELGLLPPAEHPADNPFSESKAELGRTLFHDARLSAGAKLACVSCHEPALGWADGRAVAQPPGPAPRRNSLSIRDVVHRPRLLWDGRTTSLERQAEEALANPAEMAAEPARIVAFVTRSPGYRKLFAAAFPGEEPNHAAVVKALACFERTVVSGRSRFDAFVRGEAGALSDAEILGLDLFRREARCLNCHHGPAFTDGLFHDLGLSFAGRSHEDLGRHAVTLDPADRGRFRTPSLRDVTATPPLMHNGMFRLSGVLNMYNAGMVTLKRQPHERDAPLLPQKSPLLRPLGLNRRDLADLEAFLGALAEPPHRLQPPALPDAGADTVSAAK